MKQKTLKTPASESASLRGRVRRFYEHLNQKDLEFCFNCIDPKLRDAAKVDRVGYVDSIGEFLRHYGEIRIWKHINVSLHLDAKTNKQDNRPFAYVYVFWQDKHHAFHVFRERWVKHEGRWYTRVVGLVAHENNK